MTSQPAPHTNLALIVSLCVNLLLAGVIATAVIRHALLPPEPALSSEQQPPERSQMHQLLSPRFLSHIAPGQAGQIRSIVDRHRGQLNHLKGEAMSARRQVLALFAAPQLDKAALEKALARTQSADAALEQEVMRITVEVAPILTPEQRQKAADWHSRYRMGGPLGGGQMGGGHMGGGQMGWREGAGPMRQQDRD
jgi:Spy/CpxP family protein refolding chaperone